MNTNLKPRVFTIDGGGMYPGYTYGTYWNGWECPLFTLEVGKRMVEDLMELFDDHSTQTFSYDEEDDCFYYWDINIAEDYWNAKGEAFPAEEHVNPETGEIMTLYPIGSHSWIWRIV